MIVDCSSLATAGFPQNTCLSHRQRGVSDRDGPHESHLSRDTEFKEVQEEIKEELEERKQQQEVSGEEVGGEPKGGVEQG